MLCSLTSGPHCTQSASFRDRLWLAMFLLFLAAVTLLTMRSLSPNRCFVVNLSPSLPLGLYRRVHDEPAVGQLVEFPLPVEPPNGARHTFARPVLKPIVAAAGDHVDTSGDWLWINGNRIAPIHTTDSTGHALPVWRARRRLQEDEFFTYSARVPNSFDSRYYGPVQRRNIIGVYVPLWTWGEAVELNETSPVPSIAAE